MIKKIFFIYLLSFISITSYAKNFSDSSESFEIYDESFLQKESKNKSKPSVKINKDNTVDQTFLIKPKNCRFGYTLSRTSGNLTCLRRDPNRD